MTDREAFLAVVANGPLLPADCIAVWSGDGDTRLEVGLQLLRQGAAHHCIVQGGIDDSPHALTAPVSAEWLISRGVPPKRIIEENETTNTHEQAEWLADWLSGRELEWNRVLLPCSPYHMPRVFLTMLKSMQVRGLDDRIHVVPVPGAQSWWQCPAGLDTTRLELFRGELEKIELYREYEHVASYADGLAYMARMEAR